MKSQHCLFIYGKTYRLRSINLILKRIAGLKAQREKFYDIVIGPWCKEASAIGTFWGREKNQNKRLAGPQIVFEFSERGYSTNSAETDITLQALIVDNNKIPLMIHDPKWKSVVEILEERLKGKEKQIPQCQDLVTRHQKFSIRDNHWSRVYGMYLELLYHLIQEKQLTEKSGGCEKLVVLKNEGLDFYILISNFKPRLIDNPITISV